MAPAFDRPGASPRSRWVSASSRRPSRNSWPLWTATVRTHGPGSTCCGTCACAACATPSWLSVMARSASGKRSGRSFPRTREQRCWVHKTQNVLAALPQRVQGEAKRALHAVSGAATRAEALDAARAFGEQFAQWPKATAKASDDLERLLAFHDFPAEHHVHLRTTNPIESTFATVRLRQRVTKGAGSRSAGLAMAYKLLDSAQQRWRRANAPHLVAVVRSGGVSWTGCSRNERSARTAATNQLTRGTPPDLSSWRSTTLTISRLWSLDSSNPLSQMRRSTPSHLLTRLPSLDRGLVKVGGKLAADGRVLPNGVMGFHAAFAAGGWGRSWD